MKERAVKRGREVVKQRPVLGGGVSVEVVEMGEVEGVPNGCGEEHEAGHEGSSFHHVGQWAEEEQAGGVSGLHDGGDLGDLGVRDVEVIC